MPSNDGQCSRRWAEVKEGLVFQGQVGKRGAVAGESSRLAQMSDTGRSA